MSNVGLKVQCVQLPDAPIDGLVIGGIYTIKNDFSTGYSLEEISNIVTGPFPDLPAVLPSQTVYQHPVLDKNLFQIQS